MSAAYHDIVFHPDGSFGFIYDDAVVDIARAISGGPLQIRRASDVEATDDGDGWTAAIRDWVPGGAVVLGPYPLRGQALAAEVAHLRKVLA